MEAYSGFAQVYDMFMDNVPYDQWAKNMQTLLKEAHITQGLVVDLGCGTGKMTRRLDAMGYDMIGVDYSYDMLSLAMDENYDGKILYLGQDMRELELMNTAAAFVSVCDSMNYITSVQDLRHVFCRVHQFLEPGGVFLFDMNTLYKYEQLLGENTFAENRDIGSFIWENYYDKETRINEYDLTLYISQGKLYERMEEVHYQKGYELKEVKELLEACGLTVRKIVDTDTLLPPKADCERVYFMATKNDK